jgi:multicomponent Na+:H+ antiporter subunit G
MIREIIAIVLMLIGVLFMLVAAIGIIRMPDLFLRMSAVSKAASLGVACILLAVAVDFNDLGISARILAAIVFVVLTAPVASHMIGRAAYLVGVPIWKGAFHDDLRGCYHRETHTLANAPLPDNDEPQGNTTLNDGKRIAPTG